MTFVNSRERPIQKCITVDQSKTASQTSIQPSKADVADPSALNAAPVVPDHKTGEANEDTTDDLFEIIEKESAELMEAIKN